MLSHLLSLSILAAYAFVSGVFAVAWNRTMPSFDWGTMGGTPSRTHDGGQVIRGTGALGMATGGIDNMTQNMTPGVAIPLIGIAAGAMAFMVSTTMVPSWFFGVPEVTLLHKALLYSIGFSWAWVAMRSMALASLLLRSGQFIVVGLVLVPLWFVGSWIQPLIVSSHQKYNACTLEAAISPGLKWVEDAHSQCAPPPETPVGTDLTGVWSGEYICMAGDGMTHVYGVKLILTNAKDGSIRGRYEVSSGGDVGVFQVHGKATANKITLTSDKWIEGSKILPALNIEASQGQGERHVIYGSRVPRNCSSFSVSSWTQDKVKAAQAQETTLATHLKKIADLGGGISATKSTKTSRALPGLRGIWSGGQICGLEQIGMQLLLKGNAEGQIEGVLVIHPTLEKPSDAPYGSYRVSGDIKGTKVSLRAGSWISQPSGYIASDLNFELFNARTPSLSGPLSLNDNVHWSAIFDGPIREMIGKERLTRSCNFVYLYNEVESIEWN